MTTEELKFRVTEINNPIMNYYCIITFPIDSKQPIRASVRQRQDVNGFMQDMLGKYNNKVSFEFYGSAYTAEAYNTKETYQRHIMRYEGMTDRDRARLFK